MMPPKDLLGIQRLQFKGQFDKKSTISGVSAISCIFAPEILKAPKWIPKETAIPNFLGFYLTLGFVFIYFRNMTALPQA